MDELNEWELSKENVQPLRQGRRMASLTAGLQPQNELRVRNERHVFETELRTYTGDDPIDTWYKYIRWAEQTFPKGGAESNLTSIVERCVRQFKEVEKYRNDERYIYAWMKMADICNEPLEIYSFMYDHNIGCELSSFYIGWATLYEELGNVKKADAVYLKGKRKNARPFEILAHRHEEFEKRVARKIMEGQELSDQEDSGVPESWGQEQGQRQVFSQLKTSGKKHLAPVNRTGNAIAGSAGVLPGARPKTTQQIPTGIPIYQDENQTRSSLPPQTNEWKSMPKQDVTNKENEKKAGVWTKQKLGNRGLNIPVSSVSTYRQPNFTVYVDETDPSLRTPIKKPELGHQVLSSRKEKPTSTVDYLRSMTADPNKNEKPMYCKEKIYGGVEEFSFEELRAFRWKKEYERKKQEEETRELKNSRQRLEEERRLLLEESQRVQNERLKIQQQEQALINYSRQKLQEQRLRIEQEGQKELERHQEMIEQTIQRRIQQQMSTSNSLVSRQHPFEDSQLSNSHSTENLAPEIMAALHISQGSLNTSNRTPNSDSAVRSNPSSSERSDQPMFGSASPTVNTKEALMLVRGMFNSSLESSKCRIDEETAMDQDGAEAMLSPRQNQGSVPFQIFDENEGRSDIQKTKPSAAPFQIYDETKEKRQENRRKEAPFTIFQDAVADVSSPSRQTNTPMATSPYRTVNSLTDQQSRQPETYLHRQSKRSTAMFDEDNTVSIESHAREDITLAPLGSHQSFAEAAKFVSTPFNKPKGGAGNSKSFNNESQLDTRAEVEENVEQKKENESERSLTSNSAAWPQSLSPIMEGSSEDSGASSKSACQTLQTKHNPNLSTIDGTPGNVEPPEDTMSLLQLKPLAEANTSNTHVIDISTYLPPDLDEKTENFLSMSINLYDPRDPFDVEMKDKILKNLKQPLMMYDSYEQADTYLPDIRKGSDITLGMQVYKVISKIGQGGFAKVYVAEKDDDMTFDLTRCTVERLAIKVEEPCQYWEFYICNEVQKRLGALNDPVDIRPAMMNVHRGWFFKNGSCLITDYHPSGTLLDLANLYKKIEKEETSVQAEPVTVYMTIELLHMIEKLHKCNIIHGDIKPDNFLFLQYPKLPNSADPVEVFSGQQRFAQLIDFGQSIDMTKYKAGTTFLTKVNTKCFQCTEMKTNRPWTYQTDYFGLAGTIHVLIFQQYMNVYQEGGEWKMTSKINRHWNNDLWKKLFHILLNVPSCDELPDLSKIRCEFEKYFVTKLLPKYNKNCDLFNFAISQCEQ